MSNKILCRFGEVSTKLGNRNDFIKILKKNLQVAFNEIDGVSIERKFDHIIIHYNPVDQQVLVDRLKTVFGLSSFSIVEEVDLSLEKIVEVCSMLMSKQPSSTFKVITKRMNKSFPYSSDEINRAVAASILKSTEHVVDVKKPEIPVKIEIKHHKAFVSVETFVGLQGMPVRMANRGALMLSGGFDSPIAGYMANKRGIEYIAIHFETIPFTSLQALDKVLKLAQKVSLYQNKTEVYVVPFAPVQMKINEYVPESYRIIVMRRMMVRIANEIAKVHGASVLITGESVGQVASQTISSITRINEVSDLLILRPLITYDKNEIISIAKTIDTFDISVLPYDDCCSVFTPSEPITNPLKEKTERFESFYDYTPEINQAIVDVKKYVVNPKEIIIDKE